MREYDREWGRLPAGQDHRIDAPGVSVRNVAGLSQHMVSGNLEAAARRAGVDAEGVGAMGLVSGGRYALRLARDRLLVVSDEDGLLDQGWCADGYAVSGMSAALEVFELTGPQSLEIVKRATTLFHAAPGPCAATGFAGVTACVYRFGSGQTVRVHLDRGLASYLWTWLETAVETLNPADGVVVPHREPI